MSSSNKRNATPRKSPGNKKQSDNTFASPLASKKIKVNTCEKGDATFPYKILHVVPEPYAEGEHGIQGMALLFNGYKEKQVTDIFYTREGIKEQVFETTLCLKTVFGHSVNGVEVVNDKNYQRKMVVWSFAMYEEPLDRTGVVLNANFFLQQLVLLNIMPASAYFEGDGGPYYEKVNCWYKVFDMTHMDIFFRQGIPDTLRAGARTFGNYIRAENNRPALYSFFEKGSIPSTFIAKYSLVLTNVDEEDYATVTYVQDAHEQANQERTRNTRVIVQGKIPATKNAGVRRQLQLSGEKAIGNNPVSTNDSNDESDKDQNVGAASQQDD